jgi:hypothetical protein
MVDFNPPSPEDEAAELARQERRRERRKYLRAENQMRPRCAGCEGDILVFLPDDVFTEEQLRDECRYRYLRDEFRAGDILCFWCWNDFTGCGESFQWGHV